MSSKPKPSKAAYSPVLKRERKNDHAERGQPRGQTGQNPFEDNACWGRSVVFWVLAAVLVVVIVAVILTISFVLTSYQFGNVDDRYLNSDCLDREGIRGYDDDTFAEGSNDFGRRLYDQLTTTGPQENLVVSPYSLYTVLSLLLTGSEDQTAMNLKDVLGLPCDNDTVWMETYRSIAKRLDTNKDSDKNKNGGKDIAGTDFVMESVNQAYLDTDFVFTSDFLRTSVEYFGFQPQRMDFDKSDEAIRAINAFVEKNTRGKIRDLLAPGSVGGQTRFVLLNAVYFRAGWLHPFEANKTTNHSFALMSGGSMDVDMMELEADLLSEDVPQLNAQVLKLPYYGEKAHMLIILPNENTKISEVELALLADDSYLTKGLEIEDRARTLVKIPKFRIESSHDLKPILQNLGLGNIFSADSDLSGISGRPDLAVDEVLQKAFIEVNEKGTEAAAATAIFSKSAIIDLKVEKEIICDRPFIFMIRDEDTGMTLFEGKVVHPLESSATSFADYN